MTADTPHVRIRQIRIPEAYDDAAAAQLEQVADLVRRSREAVWGTGELSNGGEDIFRDLHDPWERVVLLGAYLDDVLVGRAEVRLPLVVETRSAALAVTVDPEHEHLGVGAELLAAAEQLAQAEARRELQIQTEHPGPQDLDGDGRVGTGTGVLSTVDPSQWVGAEDSSGRLPLSNRQTRFAVRMGYHLRTVSDISRLSVPLRPQDVATVEQEVAALPSAREYRILTWIDRAPEERLESLARLHQRIPSDSFVRPAFWDPEPWDAQRVRRTEQLRAEGGDRSLMAVAEHVPSGELVGMTELVVTDAHSACALQDETLVLREHRGRRLGVRLKTANIAQLAEAFDHVRSTYAWTHSGNTRMNWVNRRLGAVVVGRSGVWAREVELA